MAFWQVRTVKALITALDKPWSNTWEAFTVAADVGSITGLANQLITAEQQIHTTSVRFLGWAANLYLTQSDKFDPALAPDGSTTVTGLRSMAASGLYDCEMCYQWKFKTPGRAYGKKGFRACLREDDVFTDSSGRASIAGDSDLRPTGTAYNNFTTQLINILEPDSPSAYLCCYTRFQTSGRKVVPKTYGPWAGYAIESADFLKLGNIDMDHGWFNRS